MEVRIVPSPGSVRKVHIALIANTSEEFAVV